MSDIKTLFATMNLKLNDTQVEQYNKYTELLIDYNNKVN